MTKKTALRFLSTNVNYTRQPGTTSCPQHGESRKIQTFPNPQHSVTARDMSALNSASVTPVGNHSLRPHVDA